MSGHRIPGIVAEVVTSAETPTDESAIISLAPNSGSSTTEGAAIHVPAPAPNTAMDTSAGGQDYSGIAGVIHFSGIPSPQGIKPWLSQHGKGQDNLWMQVLTGSKIISQLAQGDIPPDNAHLLKIPGFDDPEHLRAKAAFGEIALTELAKYINRLQWFRTDRPGQHFSIRSAGAEAKYRARDQVCKVVGHVATATAASPGYNLMRQTVESAVTYMSANTQQLQAISTKAFERALTFGRVTTAMYIRLGAIAIGAPAPNRSTSPDDTKSHVSPLTDTRLEPSRKLLPGEQYRQDFATLSQLIGTLVKGSQPHTTTIDGRPTPMLHASNALECTLWLREQAPDSLQRLESAYPQSGVSFTWALQILVAHFTAKGWLQHPDAPTLLTQALQDIAILAKNQALPSPGQGPNAIQDSLSAYVTIPDAYGKYDTPTRRVRPQMRQRENAPVPLAPAQPPQPPDSSPEQTPVAPAGNLCAYLRSDITIAQLLEARQISMDQQDLNRLANLVAPEHLPQAQLAFTQAREQFARMQQQHQANHKRFIASLPPDTSRARWQAVDNQRAANPSPNVLAAIAANVRSSPVYPPISAAQRVPSTRLSRKLNDAAARAADSIMHIIHHAPLISTARRWLLYDQ